MFWCCFWDEITTYHSTLTTEHKLTITMILTAVLYRVYVRVT